MKRRKVEPTQAEKILAAPVERDREEGKTFKLITVRLHPAMIERAKAYREKTGTPLSTLLMDALGTYLKARKA